jgi:hypothetical protein
MKTQKNSCLPPEADKAPSVCNKTIGTDLKAISWITNIFYASSMVP